MSETQDASLPVLDPETLRGINERATVKRELLPIPELGGSLCVWGLSCKDRLLVEQLVASAGENQAVRNEVELGAWVSMAVRTSLDDDALQVWQGDVLPEARAKILGFGDIIVDRIMRKSRELTGEGRRREEALEAIAGFMREAAAPTLSCLERLCSQSAASEGCPLKSSGACPIPTSPMP